MDRVIDQAIRECAANTTSSVYQVLTRVFGNNHADMVLFFTDLFCTKEPSSSEGGDSPTLTIHYHQKSFRSAFLKHARLFGLEEEPDEHEDSDAPAVKTTELSSNKASSNRGRKRRFAVSGSSLSTSSGGLDLDQQQLLSLRNGSAFQVKFLLRSGPLVIARRYHTLVSIRLVCATLMDSSWHNTCQSLSDIPYLLVWLLLRFRHNPAPRNFVVQTLLTEQARADVFVQYQIQNPNELFSQRLEMIFAEKAAETLSSRKQLREKLQDAFSQQSDQEKADEILKGSGPLDPDLLTLTTYMYFRYRMSDLKMPHDRVKPMFTLLMCIFEELARSTNEEQVGEDADEAFRTRVESAVDVMTSATKIQAANDIRVESNAYRRLLDIAGEIHLFMKRRARGNEIIAHGGNMQELDQSMAIRVSLIQKIYCSMGRIERRLNELKLLESMRESYDLMSERKLFFWAKTMQVPWKGLVQELSRRLASYQAQSLMAFANKYPDLVVFVTEENRVHAHQVLASVRYLNRKYPAFRMQVMGFRSAPNNPAHPVDVEIENSEDLLRPEGDTGDDIPTIKPLLTRNDAMAVIHDGSLCIVVFSSPKAHQRMCSYELLETLTTFGHEKPVPFYTHLLRLYAGVFEKVEDSDAEPHDDQENLSIVVQILVYQLCRYTPNRYKRMITSVSRCVLHRGHLLFDVYRWLHWICERLDAYMQKYPFFCVYGDAESRATYKEQHQALANTCDVILCFLCLNTMHLVPGGVLERVRVYLDGLRESNDSRFDSHKDLYLYLCHLKKTLDAIPEAPKLKEDEKNFVALQFYVKEIYRDELHLKSKLFKELLFDEAYQHRDKERRVWLNVLMYKFCVDRSMDLELCGEVLFKMNYEIEKVDRRIYWRQTRIEGKDRDVVSTGARTPRTPGTPSQMLSAPNTPRDDVSGSRPSTPRPGTPSRAEAEAKARAYDKLARRTSVGEWNQWAGLGRLPDTDTCLGNYAETLRACGDEDVAALQEPKEHQVSARHMVLRQIDRDAKAGFGWVQRDRSNWRNPPHPFSEGSKRHLFFGLNRMFSETPLFVACQEYSFFFAWPRIKPGPDEVQRISYERIKHVTPPGPIYYLKGDEITNAKLSESSTRLGSWRFQTVGIQDQDKIEPLAVIMRELEWLLHHRSYTDSHAAQHYRVVNSSPCIWTLRAEDFVRKQLNSRLPVEYRTIKPAGTTSHDQVMGEFVCLEDALWILQTEVGRDQETSAAPAASSSVKTPSPSPDLSAAAPSMPAPSDAELRYICREHSKTFSGTLANIGTKAESVEELPLVRFIRSCVLPEPEPSVQMDDEVCELLQEGLVPNFFSASNHPKPAARPTKKRPPEPAPTPAAAQLYSNSSAPRPRSLPTTVEGYEDLGFEIDQYGSHGWVEEMSGYYNQSSSAPPPESQPASSMFGDT